MMEEEEEAREVVPHCQPSATRVRTHPHFFFLFYIGELTLGNTTAIIHYKMRFDFATMFLI